MPLDDICQKIIDEAEAEAGRIAEDGRLELEEKIARKERQSAAALSAIEAHNLEKIRQERGQAEFRLRQTEKNALLVAKQKAIDDLFAAAKEKLLAAGDDEYSRIYAKALREAPVLAGAEAICSRRKKDLMKKALSAAGLSYPLSSEYLPAGREGLVLRSDTADIDLTLDAILAQAREDNLGEISEALFK